MWPKFLHWSAVVGILIVFSACGAPPDEPSEQALGSIDEALTGPAANVTVRLAKGAFSNPDEVQCEAQVKDLVPGAGFSFKATLGITFPSGSFIYRIGTVSVASPIVSGTADGTFSVSLTEQTAGSGLYTLKASFKHSTTERTAGKHRCSFLLQQNDTVTWTSLTKGAGDTEQRATTVTTATGATWHMQNGSQLSCWTRLAGGNTGSTYYVDFSASDNGGIDGVTDVAVTPSATTLSPIALRSGSLGITRTKTSLNRSIIDVRLDFASQGAAASTCNIVISENDPAGNTAFDGTSQLRINGETDPTTSSLSADGPYTVSSYSSGFADSPDYAGATIYYPTNGAAPYGGVAAVPGYTEHQADIDWWGTRLASHGFVIIVIDTNDPKTDGPAKRATALMSALGTLTSENSRTGSPVYGLIDTTRYAIMGHSMGGGGTLIAANDFSDQLRAAIPITPWASTTSTYPNITVPTLVMTGEIDTIAEPAQFGYPFYSSIPTTTHKAFMEIAGGDHFIGNTGTPYAGIVGRYGISWFKLYVDGDERYRPFLYGAQHDADVAANNFSRYESTP